MTPADLQRDLRGLGWQSPPSDSPVSFDVVWLLRDRVRIDVYPDGAVVTCFNHKRRVPFTKHPSKVHAISLDAIEVSKAIRLTVADAGLLEFPS
jgi:hypothetical protein